MAVCCGCFSTLIPRLSLSVTSPLWCCWRTSCQLLLQPKKQRQPHRRVGFLFCLFFFFLPPLPFASSGVPPNESGSGRRGRFFGLVGLRAACPGARSQSLLIGLAIQPGLPTVSLCKFHRGQGECTTGQAYETLTTDCAFTVRGRLRVCTATYICI